MITFKELSVPLKLIVVFGYAYMTLMLLAFVSGFILGYLGV